MIDSQVEYRSIIMRCDRIDKSAYLEPASNVEFVCYQKGMEAVWADIQKNAGEFDYPGTDRESDACFKKIYDKRGLCEVGKDQDLRRYLIADKDMRNRKPTADSRGEVPCTGL